MRGMGEGAWKPGYLAVKHFRSKTRVLLVTETCSLVDQSSLVYGRDSPSTTSPELSSDEPPRHAK